MLFLGLIVICLYLNEFTLAFTPKTVWGPSAVFTDSKIYITGGLQPKNPNNFDGLTFSNEFYYLDVKQPIVVKVGEPLPWKELSSQGLPDHAWSAFSNCGLDDSLILYIGENDTFIANFVYIYGISSKQWNSIATTNPPLSNFHSQTQTVCDVKTRKMYRFGGMLPSSPENKYNYNLDILDASTLVWEIVNAPEQRFDHTGTLLRSGNIVYIGGTIHDNGVNSLADMLKLPLYNTYDNKWTSMTTTGYSPARRACHSAVLTQDGRIIVYGGCDADIAAVNDDLVILDTSQTVYTWSKANVISATDPPLPRCYHTATLVGDHMIVLFGRDNTQLSNETFILDTSDKSNYKWVSEFDPNPKPSTQNKNVTIGIIILSIVLFLVGSSVLIYFYRKRKLSKSDKFVQVPQIN